MCRSVAVLFLLLVALLGGSVGAQPDRTAALTKAKAKFEQDISKSEDVLIASIDKALAKAAGNKALTDKLAYEREQFVSQRILPTAVLTATYLKQRGQAIATLEAVYVPTIKALTKAKKDADAETLEIALSDAIKAARGYGLAFPGLETHPMLLIENKTTGLVLETKGNQGAGELILGPKVGKRKPSQCWYFEREEKGFVIRNVASGEGFHVPAGSGNAGTVLVTWSIDRTKEVGPWSLFQVTDARREIVIATVTNGLVLTATERKLKGVTTHYVTQEKKETPPLSSQRWILTEAK